MFELSVLTVLYSLYSESRGRGILNLRLTCAYIMRHSEKVRRNGRKTTDFFLDVYIGQFSMSTSGAAFTGAESDGVY